MAEYMVDEYGVTHVVQSGEDAQFYGRFVCLLNFSTARQAKGYANIVWAHMMGAVFPTCLECVVKE